MSVNWEELKRMIDRIPEQDVLEVVDFIGYLNMKREKEALSAFNVESFSEEKELIRQIQESREDRKTDVYTAKNKDLSIFEIRLRSSSVDKVYNVRWS